MRKPLSLKIGISGVRGVVGESLTPQLVTSFAAAYGTYAGAGPVLIGTDTRPSRDMVKQAAIAGLLSVGCTPVDLGIVPVPALQFHIRQVGAFGGICITASHNPIEWNALKFFRPDGIVLRPNQAFELTDLYHQGVFPRVPAGSIAEVRRDETALTLHRQTILAAVDVEAIRARRFRVAVDCCNGAASRATPDFLRDLGCQVIAINTDPDLPFPHNPEPLPENIGDLCRTVREADADLGFAQDADADRLAIVDERGVPLGEDCTVALAVRHALRASPGPVVVNVSTSRMVDDVAAELGCPVCRTRVGEINVVERMLELGSPVGGEGNGGVIVPALNPCRDSFVGMAMILEALAREGGTIREMRERIPTYAMEKARLACAARDIAPALRRLRAAFAGETVDETDGVKVVWPDRWLQARASNTEPIIRVVAEAPTEEAAAALVREALACLAPSQAIP
ncbi:MAG: phosphoglucosamine mutase [Chthonomonadales bacterium]|nr:phosphoglucosamine mutase [Chthonomonadales bacterium]